MTVQRARNRVFIIWILWIAILLGCFIKLQTQFNLDGQFIGPDAYRFFRQTRIIVEEGNFPSSDLMRWVPNGVNSKDQLLLFPYILAYFFKLLSSIFPSFTLYQFAINYPVVVFAATSVIFFFLYVRFLEFLLLYFPQ